MSQLRDGLPSSEEEWVMWKYMTAMLALTVLGIAGGQPVRARTYGTPEEAAVAKLVKDAKVTLQQGLAASQHEGTPISGKFEVEHEKPSCPSTR